MRWLLGIYLMGLLVFTVFRLLLLATNTDAAAEVPTSILLQALWMGFRFDTVISGYILALPLVVLSLADGFGKLTKLVQRSIAVFLAVGYVVAFLLCATDVPYYGYFQSRLTVAVLAWTGTPGQMVSQVTGSWIYMSFLILFLVLAAGWGWWLWRRRLPVLATMQRVRFPHMLPGTLIALALLMLGIRGRLEEKAPIQWGTAFFSEYAFANQLGINPVFTFIRSYLDGQSDENKLLELMDDRQALAQARRHLRIQDRYDSPLARKVTFGQEAPRRINVVIVLMESMSAEKTGVLGSRKDRSLTPNLDRLWSQSISFPHFYSAGIHTYNGIYSSLYGLPALRSHHTMMSTRALQPYRGLPVTLREQGYSTAFFTTHDSQYDNMGGFLLGNGFQEMHSQEDYPAEEVVSSAGVPDEYLFKYVIPQLDRLHQQKKPFLAVMLTGSDHPPFTLPEKTAFVPKATDVMERCTEYADWSIGQFVKQARQQPWFDSTIFVFVADHGMHNHGRYDVDLNYHHIPLILYAPALLEHEVRPQLGGQIDLFATLMGLLRIPYINNSLGIDLLREQRPFIFFSSDDKMAALNHKYLWIRRDNGVQSLYHYTDNSRKDYKDDLPALTDSLRSYTYSMLQTAQWVLEQRKAASIAPAH